MSEMNNTKEVYFHEWCNKCKYGPLMEHQEPCNTCLGAPMNFDSHKPTKYEEEKK